MTAKEKLIRQQMAEQKDRYGMILDLIDKDRPAAKGTAPDIVAAYAAVDRVYDRLFDALADDDVVT